MNRDVDREARRISAMATPDDIAAARAFLEANAAQGRPAAMATPAAAHLIRRFDIGRCLGSVARRIVADHPEETR